jgi:hypothetical protein
MLVFRQKYLPPSSRLQSLVDYINSKVEPAYRQQKPSEPKAPEILSGTSVQKVGLNESFRIIISLRVEKGAETTAARTSVSSICADHI